jgi:hypothetical protein
MVVPIMVKYKALAMPMVIKKKIEDIKAGLRKKHYENDPDFINIFEGPDYP